MRATEGQHQQLGPWPAGSNNLADEASIPRASFRRGINVVVADDGKISRREGFERVIEADEPHSLYGSGRRAFFVEAGSLYAIEVYDDRSVSEPIEIYDALAHNTPLAYCLIEPDIYVSDGTQALRILPSSNVVPWSLPIPAMPLRGGDLLGGGSLQTGRYAIAISYRAANGEEGPLSASLVIDQVAPAQPVITLPPTPAGVQRVLIYMTKPNGTELLFAASVAPSATSYTVAKQALGRPAPNADLDPLPAGRFAAYFAGRLLIAAGTDLYWSAPMQYSLYNPAYDYSIFGEDITGIGVIGETNSGFFVGQSSRTYFVRGANPSDTELHEVYSAGMVPGTLTTVPGARLPMENPPTVPVPVWLATNGVFCAGLQDGSVVPLTETRYAANVGVDGASVFVQQGGVNRLIATTRAPSDNVFAVTDSVSIEVVRNGISP